MLFGTGGLGDIFYWILTSDRMYGVGLRDVSFILDLVIYFLFQFGAKSVQFFPCWDRFCPGRMTSLAFSV